jgi:hypothetical protein
VPFSSTSEDQHRQGGRPECGDHEELDSHGQQYFDRMEAQTRRYVEFQVGVMHAVQAPQGWHGMKQHILEVDRKIEQHDGEQQSQPPRQGDCVEQSPTVCSGGQCETDRRRWKQHAHEHGVEADDAQIVGPSYAAAYLVRPARKKFFAQGNQDKQCRADDEPDGGFVT